MDKLRRMALFLFWGLGIFLVICALAALIILTSFSQNSENESLIDYIKRIFK